MWQNKRSFNVEVHWDFVWGIFFLGIVGALLRMIKKEIFGNGFRYVSCNNIKAVEKPEYRVRTSRLTHLPLSE